MATLPHPTALVIDPRSSASLRVLCAVRYKGMKLPIEKVSLREGAHQAPAFREINPSGAVPVLRLADGTSLSQSLAMLEYLDACVPAPALMPADARQAANVRSICNLVACDVHPLTNFSVRNQIRQMQGEAGQIEWLKHWSAKGLQSLEAWLAKYAGRHAVGDQLSMADFLVTPAVLNFLRFGIDVPRHLHSWKVFQSALAHDAFSPVKEWVPT